MPERGSREFDAAIEQLAKADRLAFVGLMFGLLRLRAPPDDAGRVRRRRARQTLIK
jgi:hypothetical protein